MRGFKSAILSIFQPRQNGTFEPMYGIQNFHKVIFEFAELLINIRAPSNQLN